MVEQSKYFYIYRFNDGMKYKIEIGKDGVTEEDMRRLRRVNKNEAKVSSKIKDMDAVSLEAVISGEDKHSVLIDDCVDVELLVETADEYESLHKAIEKLLPSQQELIRQRFFMGKSQRQIASEEGVSEMAIRDRLNRIYAKLEIYLKNF